MSTRLDICEIRTLPVRVLVYLIDVLLNSSESLRSGSVLRSLFIVWLKVWIYRALISTIGSTFDFQTDRS